MILDKDKGHAFTPTAWGHYVYWQQQDKKTLKKINSLIIDTLRNGVLEGEGKPERLRYMDLAWSRRIDRYNRLVYTVISGQLTILACKDHYED